MRVPSAYQFDTKGFFSFVKILAFFIAVISVFQISSSVASGEFGVSHDNSGNGAESSKVLASAATAQIAKEGDEEEFLKTRTIKGHTLAELIPKHGKYIGIDLTNMKVLLYQDGSLVETVPVLSKGKPGSHWETPSGVYTINTKEENHFSSIDHVNMPFAMQFFGNFFIHGWPTEPDGEPVPIGYSSGCVRLSTANAQKVYAFADVGTGLFVYDDEIPGPKRSVLQVKDIPMPNVSAKSYLIADIDTGQVYAQKGMYTMYPIASVTKLMTAIVANETLNFDKVVPVYGSGIWIPSDVVDKKAEKVSLGALFYPLLLDSNNEVADTLAKYYGMKNFLNWMNQKAGAIGMIQTHFADPSGLSKNNVSTVADLFKLAQYIVHKKSFILHMTRQKARAIVSSSGEKYIFENHTHFLGRDDYLGGKIGFTDEALETYVAMWKESVRGEDHRLALIVLQSDDRKADELALLQWWKRAVTE